MVKKQVISSLKMTIGVVLAMALTFFLKLDFYSSVATIVIVSMLSAKKQSLELAGTLLLTAVFSLGLASFLFTVFGFSLGVFAVYILIFTLLMYRTDTKSAIIINVALVLQVYSREAVSLSIVLNQLGLMIIGLSVSLLINVFTLDIENELIKYRKQVETLLDSILRNMGQCLNNECEEETVKKELDKLDDILTKSKRRSFDYLNSFYLEQNDYYIEYFAMRRRQYQTIVAMQDFIKLTFLNKTEVKLLKGFTDNFASNTKKLNGCQKQKKRLEEIKYHFTYLATLPTTIVQLQNRVSLHQYLYGLVNLVELEMFFIEMYEKRE